MNFDYVTRRVHRLIRKRVFDQLLKVFITRLGLRGSNDRYVFLLMFFFFVPAVVKYSTTHYFITNIQCLMNDI